MLKLEIACSGMEIYVNPEHVTYVEQGRILTRVGIVGRSEFVEVLGSAKEIAGALCKLRRALLGIV